MGNYDVFGLVLLCITLFLTSLLLLIYLSATKRKKAIILATQQTKQSLIDQLASDEIRLKAALNDFLTSELQVKITQILAVEKETCNKLTALFIDYHPAAIDMLPFLLNQIIMAYIDCLEHIVLQSKLQTNSPEITVVEASKVETVEADKVEEIDDTFQYEALIEQLRYEKHDFADKYKGAQSLLNQIYLKYKDSLGLSGPDSLEKTNIKDIAIIFKIESDQSSTNQTG